jgi:hypothetical protein
MHHIPVQIQNSPNTNERFSIIQEILPAMKLVKYYGWERFFEQHVSSSPAAAPTKKPGAQQRFDRGLEAGLGSHARAPKALRPLL